MERFFNMVLSELTADKLKAEQDLENLVNSNNTDADEKTEKAKGLLIRIDEDERAIEKLYSYMPDESSENEQ